MTADEVIAALGLQPKQTCGFVAPHPPTDLTVSGLPAPFSAQRPVGTALYFLVTPAAPVQLHRIANDQLYLYHLGGALELLLLHDDGTHERQIIGPDLMAGQRVQFRIPGGTFHTARLVDPASGWFLGGSAEWPGVIPADVELGDADALIASHPDVADDIRSFPVPR